VIAVYAANAARVCEQLASMLEIEAPELAARLRATLWGVQPGTGPTVIDRPAATATSTGI
jgi:hypothetical protein